MNIFIKWILNALIFISAVIAIYFKYADNETGFYILKPLTTIFIILIPIFYGKREENHFTHFVIAALFLCLIGDMFLLRDSGFIYGLISFLIAHLVFLYSFTLFGGMKYYWFPLIILTLIGIGFYMFLSDNLGDLSIPVVVYITIIIIMCWQGISLYVWKKKRVFLLIAFGVILFLVSDSILAIEKFKNIFDLSFFLVLVTYWTAIGLLANSTLYVDSRSV